MRSFWSDPYLWIHLAGLAAFPLFLEGCLVGFAIGDPVLPVSLELLLVAAVGIVPILWMQWQRPFYIFSLVAVTVKPENLTDDQRRLLTLFKLPRNRILAVIVPVVLVVVLQKVYEIAPIAAPAIPFPPEWRLIGLLLAALAFLACNLFVQVPVSVASVMLNSESAFTAAQPFPLTQIRQNFTLVGLRLEQILPPIISDATSVLVKPSVPAASDAPSVAAQTIDGVDPEAQDFWQEDTPQAAQDVNVDHVVPSANNEVTHTDSSPASEPEQPQ